MKPRLTTVQRESLRKLAQKPGIWPLSDRTARALAAKGLVQLKEDLFRREVHVQITEEGRALLAKETP